MIAKSSRAGSVRPSTVDVLWSILAPTRENGMDQATPSARTMSDDERCRRQKAINYARGSVRLEGFTLDPDIEALNQRYVEGKLTRTELTNAIQHAVG